MLKAAFIHAAVDSCICCCAGHRQQTTVDPFCFQQGDEPAVHAVHCDTYAAPISISVTTLWPSSIALPVKCLPVQDALLDEEGAQPGDAFGGGANAVSLKVPVAQARQEERILSAQEAHEACASSRSLQVIYVWQ